MDNVYKVLFLGFLLLFVQSIWADDDGIGQVTFWNTNDSGLVSRYQNMVQFMAVMTNNKTPFRTIALLPGDNQALQFSQKNINKDTFDVYIANVNSGTGFKKCLQGIPYDSTAKAITIAGFSNGGNVKDVDYGCTVTGADVNQ